MIEGSNAHRGKMTFGMIEAIAPAQIASRQPETASSAGSRSQSFSYGRKPGSIRAISIPGPVGNLEAVLNVGSPDAPFAALVCHPHPVFGGNLHNKVVYAAMKALNHPDWGLGFPVLRFNFRCAGLSEGKHDGKAEASDVLAALDWLQHEFHLPLVVAGFSFGAAMVLRACDTSANTARAQSCNPDLRALIALGLPIQALGRAYDYSFLRRLSMPKLVVSGDRDQFAPVEQLTQMVRSAADPKRLFLLPDSDHFFTGHLAPMQRVIANWIKEQVR